MSKLLNLRIIATDRGSDQYAVSMATLECGHRRSTLKIVGDEERCIECELRADAADHELHRMADDGCPHVEGAAA